MDAPKNWLKMIENIRMVRRKFPAPVDSMGCDQSHYVTDKPIEQRFLILVSLMLSSQTKDPITWSAVQKLRANGLGRPERLVEAKVKDIEDLIHPVGFYRRKAIYLKKVSEIVLQKYNGDIPNSLEDLCKLPGVGPKMAHLCMQEAWNVVAGIGVDTHVHRIVARLGWLPGGAKIKTPEDTRKALEQWLPREYWREINHMLVGFGQTICTPVRPKCSECANSELCPSSSVNKSSARVASGSALASAASEFHKEELCNYDKTQPQQQQQQQQLEDKEAPIFIVDSTSTLSPSLQVAHEKATAIGASVVGQFKKVASSSGSASKAKRVALKARAAGKKAQGAKQRQEAPGRVLRSSRKLC